MDQNTQQGLRPEQVHRIPSSAYTFLSEIENTPQFQQWLRPEPERHIPLTHNFYEKFLRQNPGYNESMETPSVLSNISASSAQSTRAPTKATSMTDRSVTAKVVNEIMETNKQAIEKAAMQLASTGVNVTTTQYKDLIPLSFDQEEFIRNHEASKSRK